MLYAAFDRCVAKLALASEDAIGVAASGGRDSMSLADLAHRRRGPSVVLLHVDHGVRSASGEDAGFVQAWAKTRGLGFAMERLSLERTDEASLRAARYASLERMRQEAGLPWVLLGHHADDQAETVLMSFLTRGVALPMPATRGPFVRPFLGVPSEAIREYAMRQGISWREDPSNQDPRWLRNRVRRELIPLLETAYRPGLRRRLSARGEGTRGTVGLLTDWPADVGPSDVVFDAAEVKSPCHRPMREDDRWEAELGGRLPLLQAQGAWIIADGDRLLWAPGFVARETTPRAGTRRVWIFEWK